MLTEKQQSALDVFTAAAVAAERASAGWLGVPFPALAIVTQWAVETGWSLDKMTGSYNAFGLTSAACPDRPKKFCPTQEELTVAQFVVIPFDERQSVTQRVDLGHGRYRYHLSRWFASFDSLQDGIAAYIRVITAPGHRYYAAWQAYMRDLDIDALLAGIAQAGYASSAGYGALLRQIAHQDNVRTAIERARAMGEVSAPRPNIT